MLWKAKFGELFIRVDSLVTMVHWTSECLTNAIGVVRSIGGQ